MRISFAPLEQEIPPETPKKAFTLSATDAVCLPWLARGPFNRSFKWKMSYGVVVETALSLSDLKFWELESIASKNKPT